MTERVPASVGETCPCYPIGSATCRFSPCLVPRILLLPRGKRGRMLSDPLSMLSLHYIRQVSGCFWIQLMLGPLLDA